MQMLINVKDVVLVKVVMKEAVDLTLITEEEVKKEEETPDQK